MRVLMVAGGTGGHLIPAIAFGRWLEAHDVEWDLVTGSRPLEADICRAHEVEPYVLPVSGSPLGGGWLRMPSRSWRMLRARSIGAGVMRDRRPDLCLLFGGYLSLPLFFASRSLKIPTALHEQNVVAGRANRLLARLGCPVLTAWNECRGVANFTPVGLPVRPMALVGRARAQRELVGRCLSPDEKMVVVLGGSLGSGGLVKALSSLSVMVQFDRWKFLFVGLPGGRAPFDGAWSIGAQWDMTNVYSAADVLICRAGAGTLAEIEALKLRAMVIPWLEAADGHQLANAELFETRTGTPCWSGQIDLAATLVRAAERPLSWPVGQSDGAVRLWKALLNIGSEGRHCGGTDES